MECVEKDVSVSSRSYKLQSDDNTPETASPWFSHRIRSLKTEIKLAETKYYKTLINAKIQVTLCNSGEL